MIYYFVKNFSKVLPLILCLSGELCSLTSQEAIAASPPEMLIAMPMLPPAKKPELTKPDPLDLKQYPLDPLVPSQVPFTPLQRRRFIEALDELNTKAQTQADAGNLEAAFEIWYRELRARQSLETLGEIDALGRVGGIAWEKNRKEELAVIHHRLDVIQEAQNGNLTPEMLTAFAKAYKQMRSLDDSIKIYQAIRNTARQKNNIKAEKDRDKTLESIFRKYKDFINEEINLGGHGTANNPNFNVSSKDTKTGNI
jgi:hypothetical protein